MYCVTLQDKYFNISYNIKLDTTVMNYKICQTLIKWQGFKQNLFVGHLLVTDYFYTYFTFYLSKICGTSSSAADETVVR